MLTLLHQPSTRSEQPAVKYVAESYKLLQDPFLSIPVSGEHRDECLSCLDLLWSCSHILKVPFEGSEGSGIVYIWIGKHTSQEEAIHAEQMGRSMFEVS